MQTLWERLAGYAERVARIRSVATWRPYSEVMVVLPFGGLELWASSSDPGLISEAPSGRFALSPFKGELRYLAVQLKPDEPLDFEVGGFASLDDALTFVEAHLVEGRALRDILVPRTVQLAELAAKPDAAIPRPTLQYHEPPPPPPPFMQRWFGWLPKLLHVLTTPLRGFFGGVTGCLTIPAMAILIIPCIAFVAIFIPPHGISGWITTAAIGAGIAVVLTMLIVYAFVVHGMWKHMRPRRKGEEDHIR